MLLNSKVPFLGASRSGKLDPRMQRRLDVFYKIKKATLEKESCQPASFPCDLSILERQQNNRKRTILKDWVGVILQRGC